MSVPDLFECGSLAGAGEPLDAKGAAEQFFEDADRRLDGMGLDIEAVLIGVDAEFRRFGDAWQTRRVMHCSLVSSSPSAMQRKSDMILTFCRSSSERRVT